MRINRGFLLGKAVDPDIEVGIYDLLKGRPSIEAIYAVQSRWGRTYHFCLQGRD
jgi:hypothetical protein